VRRFTVERASVIVTSSTAELGDVAATFVADRLVARVAEHGAASVILATGNSQVAFLEALAVRPDVPWDRIAVFHMDEYVGIPADHPASFRRYMRERLVDLVGPRAFHGIDGDALDLEAEMRRYTGLLAQDPPDLCVLGIGENGHLAFNDPPADFAAVVPIHIVELSQASRRQQVGEGHFPSIADVPVRAITLTIPTLLAPAAVLAVVPEGRKAAAVAAALEGPLTADLPASILRQTDGVTIVLDADSSSLLHPASLGNQSSGPASPGRSQS
jgi:glucosamine-6-phosphate deaminase